MALDIRIAGRYRLGRKIGRHSEEMVPRFQQLAHSFLTPALAWVQVVVALEIFT